MEILKEVGPPAGVARVQCNPKRLEQWLKVGTFMYSHYSSQTPNDIIIMVIKPLKFIKYIIMIDRYYTFKAFTVNHSIDV